MTGISRAAAAAMTSPTRPIVPAGSRSVRESQLRAPGTGSWGRRAWAELVSDHHRAERLLGLRRPGEDLSQAAIRFALAQPPVDTTLVGFWSATDVEAALAVEAAGPSYSDQELHLLRSTLEIS